MSAPRRRLLDEAPGLAKLALPISLGSASQILMGVFDSLMIGETGTVPLAAAAFTGGVFTFFMIAGIGLLLPVSVLVARPGSMLQRNEWLRHGTLLGLGAGLLGSVGMLSLVPLLHLFGQPQEVLDIVTNYWILIALSLGPVLVQQAQRQYSEARGDPWGPMALNALAVGLNVLLNWLLIHGHWGFPALGLEGAGLATLLSRVTLMWGQTRWLRNRHRNEEGWPKTLREWLRRPDSGRLREALSLGLPSAGQLLFEVCAFSAAAVMMGWLGAIPLAAHQIALSCVSFTFMFPLGLSQAASIRISASRGGATPLLKRRHIASDALLMTWLGMGLFSLILVLLRQRIPEAFVDDAAVTTCASGLLLVAAFFQLADGTQVVSSGCLRGLEDVKVPTLITGMAYWGLAIPCSLALGVWRDDPSGIWLGLACGLAFAAGTLTLRLQRKLRSCEAELA